MGRRYKKTYNQWIPYATALHVVQTGVQRPQSRKQYRDWHDRNRPISIPKYPERVYKDEWTSWNDFLGNDNEFAVHEKGVWRDYWDAMRYVHGLKLETRGEYKERGNQEGWPSDIPLAPQYAYSEWVDWPTWLGVTIRSRVSNMENINKCIALCNIHGQAANYFKVLVCAQGVDQLQDRMNEVGGLTVYKMYAYEDGDLEVLQRILKAHAFEHDGGEWLVPNVNELIFALDNNLPWWR